MEHVRWHSDITLRQPVMVAAFTGWNDAGDAASTAVRTMIETWDATLLASIDAEEFTDFASTRPHVRLADGVTREIVWPQVAVWGVSTPGGDVLLVLGPEPSLRWRLFTEQLISIAQRFDSRMVLSLGALLADVPHTRAVQLIGTATDQDLIDRFELQRSRYEGPTGIVGVLHDACARADLGSASLWAATPAYAAQVPSPKAALALVRRATDIIGTPSPIGVLSAQVEEYEQQVDDLINGDPELGNYVRRLESIADIGDSDDIADFGHLEDDDLTMIVDQDDDDESIGGEAGGDDIEEGDGEQLIEEVEQFLRNQDG
jgi:proteasome assembly chaperone (PAC2) family protein